MNLDEIGVRGSIGSMKAYLAAASIDAEEYTAYKPSVPIGLLRALGLERNSVPLPTEDPVSILKNSVNNLVKQVNSDTLDRLEFVEVGTETIQDGSLPLSQHVLELLPHSNVVSAESKHACIAAMNAVWKNAGDTGIVAATDIAHYGPNAADSADFTGGAGSIAMLLDKQGELVDILDACGVSSRLTHDFFKPYQFSKHELRSKTYPVVFGKYSNIANIHQVSLAYENLKSKVDIDMLDFSSSVFHAPYPGITKYNLAMLLLVDNKDDEKWKDTYKEVHSLFKMAHEYFDQRNFEEIHKVEREIKGHLKKVIKESENFETLYDRHKPSVELIKQTGNIYTGSSPLCLMSVLENTTFDAGEYILWGGYGSGNQAIFLILRTTERTSEIANNWNTHKQLDERIELTSDQYEKIKKLGSAPYTVTACSSLPEELHRPKSGFYFKEIDEYKIRSYTNLLLEEEIKTDCT